MFPSISTLSETLARVIGNLHSVAKDQHINFQHKKQDIVSENTSADWPLIQCCANWKSRRLLLEKSSEHPMFTWYSAFWKFFLSFSNFRSSWWESDCTLFSGKPQKSIVFFYISQIHPLLLSSFVRSEACSARWVTLFLCKGFCSVGHSNCGYRLNRAGAAKNKRAIRKP